MRIVNGEPIFDDEDSGPQGSELEEVVGKLNLVQPSCPKCSSNADVEITTSEPNLHQETMYIEYLCNNCGDYFDKTFRIVV